MATTAICPGTERQRRRAGCLPAARIRLSVSNLRGPKPVLRLRVRPNVPWARIDGVRLQLPRALRLEAPNAGHMSGITVGLGGRHGNPGVHPHSLNVNHLGFARSLSATLWGGALRSVGEIPPGRKLTFRVSVRFADIGRPEGEQTVVLRRR